MESLKVPSRIVVCGNGTSNDGSLGRLLHDYASRWRVKGMNNDKAGCKVGLVEIWTLLVSWESFGALTALLLGCSP
jgi:hypothetical protein